MRILERFIRDEEGATLYDYLAIALICSSLLTVVVSVGLVLYILVQVAIDLT